MDWINYHHLYYFWTVAREGSISKASSILRLARPTVSAQLKMLRDSFEEDLFKKSGRNLVLTEFGQTVFAYADEIFTLGSELKDVVSRKATGRSQHLVVGISDVLPKLIAFRILAPLMREDSNIHLVCREGSTDELVADLALHKIDAILSDSPVHHDVDVRVFHHKLGDCGLAFFAAGDLHDKLKGKFPQVLHKQPTLLPARRTTIRRSINQWYDANDLSPNVVAEFEDSALMKVFGQHGLGIFVSPSIIADDIEKQYNVKLVGITEDIRDNFYLISVERRITDPVLKQITGDVRKTLFSH